MPLHDDWNIDSAKAYFNIPQWSEGYFDINQDGHMQACLDDGRKIDFANIVNLLKKHELSLPVLLRFPQILQARARQISHAFANSINKHQYQASHMPLYPIKVNQQRTVIEHILADADVGLEVGSKTELLVALSQLKREQGLLVCNGYKDRAYIRLALLAQKLGINVYIVIEKLSELDLIEQEARQFKLQPKLGVRVRLHSIAAGNWQNTGGRNAKFGLNTNDVVGLMQRMQEKGISDWLSMLHFHMGSQIPKLFDFESGLLEALRIFQNLHEAGFIIDCLDVGGGLAIDYSAQQDDGYFSREYTLQEYTDTIISTITEYCNTQGICMPNVFTENGRGLSAHHAVLITNVVESEKLGIADVDTELLDSLPDKLRPLAEQIIRHNTADETDRVAHLSSVAKQVHDSFVNGEIDLKQRAAFEQLFKYVQTSHLDSTDEYQKLNLSTQSKYYCNFSMFRSMPDVWGIKQIFPIMPLQKLEQRPTEYVRLHDLTCDSDGQIAEYTSQNGTSDAIYLHSYNKDEEYLLGFFLLGAYQEVLGDIHNLFGDTHAVNVELNQSNELVFSEIELGDCVNELLATIHVDGQQIIDHCRDRLQLDQDLSSVDATMIKELEDALYSYTYLDSLDRNMHRIKG